MWPEFWSFVGDTLEFAAPFECAGTVVTQKKILIYAV